MTNSLETLLIRLHNARIARDRAVGEWGQKYWTKVITYFESQLAAKKMLDYNDRHINKRS